MLYYLIKVISWFFFKFIFGLQVEGREHIPKKGSFILVANHSSVFDGFILVSSIKPKITFLSADYLFKKSFYGFILRGLRAIPVQRSGSDIAALKKSIKILRYGGVLGIFPEGGIKKTGNHFSAKAGAAYLALKTNVPIVPVVIEGADKVLPAGEKWPKFNIIKVKISHAMIVSDHGNISKKMTENIVNEYMKVINGGKRKRDDRID